MTAMYVRTDTRELWRSGGISIQRFRYHAERHGWGDTYSADSDAICLLRRGAFRRRSSGFEHVVDHSTGFYRRREEPVEASNFTAEPEDITLLEMSPDTVERLMPDAILPSGPFPVTPRVHLRHRELLNLLHVGDDDLIEEHVVDMVAEITGHPRVVHGPRTGSRSQAFQRTLISDACEILHLRRGNVSLEDLARQVGSSPFHLSRVFRSITGSTVSQYRQRIRVNEVLDRLANGCTMLAEIAVEAGFSDHSHMTRTVVAHLGSAPSELRRRFEHLAGQHEIPTE